MSPAGRPVQTTRDLASFWRTGYPEVRRELRGRYPRHPWPEDPLTAPATHRPRPASASARMVALPIPEAPPVTMTHPTCSRSQFEREAISTAVANLTELALNGTEFVIAVAEKQKVSHVARVLGEALVEIKPLLRDLAPGSQAVIHNIRRGLHIFHPLLG